MHELQQYSLKLKTIYINKGIAFCGGGNLVQNKYLSHINTSSLFTQEPRLYL